MMTDHIFIIAELSANHNNDIDLAIKTVGAIAESGADAVKVQTYKPESLTLPLSSGYFGPKEEGLWKGYTPWKLYEEAALPYEWHGKLKEYAESLGLVFFSSPFDPGGVDFLEELGVPAYKIASFEITDIPLIEYAASKGKPMIISTGVAEINDIQEAIDACKKNGNDDITILKCTSQYPATIEKANLNTIPDMKQRFGVDVGVSDHTMGSLVPVVASSLGARVVEKHFILERSLGGPDATFSMEPHEFKQMVADVRNVEKALGSVSYDVSEKDSLKRRSLFATSDIKSGELFTYNNIRSVRPGHGLPPKKIKDLINSESPKDFKAGDPIKF